MQNVCADGQATLASRRLCQKVETLLLNPFPPSVPIWHRLTKLSILILEGIIKKNSDDRRDYESVDKKSLS